MAAGLAALEAMTKPEPLKLQSEFDTYEAAKAYALHQARGTVVKVIDIGKILEGRIGAPIKVDRRGNFAEIEMHRLCAYIEREQAKKGWRLRPGWRLYAFGNVTDPVVNVVTIDPGGKRHNGDSLEAWQHI